MRPCPLPSMAAVLLQLHSAVRCQAVESQLSFAGHAGTVCVDVSVCVLQAADEPAYLTVGTDVSAKYRGAFCEAKIKTVKRMVKVKVRVTGTVDLQVLSGV